jgi:hypothetical protein
LLEKIPRLGAVARMIESQHVAIENEDPSDPAVVGGRILRAAIDFDILCQQGMRRREALDRIHLLDTATNVEMALCMSQILSAMTQIVEKADSAETRLVPVPGLEAGMILEESLHSEAGLLLLAKGEEVTPTLVERLKSFTYRPDYLVRIRGGGGGCDAAPQAFAPQLIG